MRPVVFGTAGHIDHGKTSLVRALTGVDCDRLEEEKRRGITIVLGFAALPDPEGELELSFVDVPGHERLVHTMIAGAGAIDRALLVIAADEGVMPQTREHLDVLDLLGIGGGVVALNKADLLEEELIDLRIEEVREALAGTRLAGAPIVPCSAATGAGLERLRAELLGSARGALSPAARTAGRPFRMAVDRVFSLPGAGTVVTGTARWASVKTGDELLALPSGRTVRVRGVQIHSAARDAGFAGERVALRLAGVSVEQMPRGEQLLAAGPWRATVRLAVRLVLLGDAAPLEEGDEVSFHLLAARTRARVERLAAGTLAPGGETVAMLRLARPLFAVPGDRFVIRRFSPARTLGGGRVLDPFALPIRRRDAGALERLPDGERALEAALAAWIREAGIAGTDLGGLSGRAGLLTAALEPALGALTTRRELIVVPLQPPVLLAPQSVAAVRAAATEVLEGSGSTGVPIAELLARVVPAEAARLRDFYLDDLRRAGVLREVASRAFPAGAEPLEDPLAGRVEALYRDAGFEAPSPEEAARVLAANPKVVDGLVRFLIERKRLARVGGKWVVHRGLLDEVAQSVRAWGVESFDVGQFKDRFGLTRKLAIPVLEWLDTMRVTRREGERRRVLPPRPGTGSPG